MSMSTRSGRLFFRVSSADSPDRTIPSDNIPQFFQGLAYIFGFDELIFDNQDRYRWHDDSRNIFSLQSVRRPIKYFL